MKGKLTKNQASKLNFSVKLCCGSNKGLEICLNEGLGEKLSKSEDRKCGLF